MNATGQLLNTGFATLHTNEVQRCDTELD